MNALDTTAKLADVEARMRRWHTRLTRASNMLQKLERQRRRLALQQIVGVGKPLKAKPAATFQSLPVSAATEGLTEAVAEQLGIPPFLQRKPVEHPKNKLVADKTTMPLTGRAALDAIRPKRKARA